MPTEQDKTFFSQDIYLDGKRFVHCKFSNCTLWYKGGQTEWDEKTVFSSCRWRFLDAADRTVKVLNVSTTDTENFSWSGQAFRNF